MDSLVTTNYRNCSSGSKMWKIMSHRFWASVWPRWPCHSTVQFVYAAVHSAPLVLRIAFSIQNLHSTVQVLTTRAM